MTLQKTIGETVKMCRYGSNIIKNKLGFTQMYRKMCYRELYEIYMYYIKKNFDSNFVLTMNLYRRVGYLKFLN